MLPQAKPQQVIAASEPEVRGQQLLETRLHESNVQIDRLFGWLLLAEWAACILVALIVSPRTWSGTASSVHQHVYAALVVGGIIIAAPLLMVRFNTGATLTRHIIAVAQMLISGLLIHLTGGRIETHFIVFGSLAFLAFYRDWRVLATATVVTALDHLLRGIFLPQSVYGVVAATPWRTLEHAWWVIFEDAFLVPACLRGLSEMRSLAFRQAEIEFHSQIVEREVTEKTASLRQTTENLQVAMEAERRHIAEQDLMLKQLAEARDAAENATRAKSSFLANMSHELRTPLNAILGYSEILLEDCVSPEQELLREDLTRIHGAGKHLLGLINEILDLSKIEAGRLDLHPEIFDLGVFMTELQGTVAPLARVRENRFTLDVEGAPAFCFADAQRLKQILLNLLSNAFKFTDQGEVSLTVGWQEKKGQTGLSFAVADTGLGIDPEDAARLFSDFVQATHHDAQGRGGTGLGLALSQRLAKLTGGDITLKSVLGEGSTFTFWLPQDEHTDTVTAISTETSQAIESMASRISEAGPTRKALIIEDDLVAAELLRRHLQSAGWDVRIAPSGAEGLVIAGEWQPDAITLDVYMPVRDGWSTLQSLKANAALASIPVIMISMSDERERGLELGAAEFLAKPISGLKLAQTLDRVTDKWRERSVLIVDDDEPTRELLARQLSEAGWKVQTAPDGKAALDHLETSSCECVILDLMMPGVDGFEVLRRFRELPSGLSTPVLVLTNRSLAPEEEHWLSDHNASVMQKAETPRAELLRALQTLVDPQAPTALVGERTHA